MPHFCPITIRRHCSTVSPDIPVSSELYALSHLLTNEPGQTMQQCCACREEIKTNATRCPHCSSTQGWRRIFTTPVLICSSIVTILSVGGLEPIKHVLTPPRADLRPAIIGGDFHQMNFTLTNLGARAATLVNVEIAGKTKRDFTGVWFVKTAADGKVLEPGKSYEIKASNGSLIPGVVDSHRAAFLKRIHGFSNNCQLLVTYAEVDGQQARLSYPYMCDPVD